MTKEKLESYVLDLNDKVTELRVIVMGVESNNGLRGKVNEIKDALEKHVEVDEKTEKEVDILMQKDKREQTAFKKNLKILGLILGIATLIASILFAIFK